MVKSPGFKQTSSFQSLTWNSSRSWDELLCGSILTISLYVGLNSLMGMLVSPQRQASNMASWMKTYCSLSRNEGNEDLLRTSELHYLHVTSQSNDQNGSKQTWNPQLELGWTILKPTLIATCFLPKRSFGTIPEDLQGFFQSYDSMNSIRTSKPEI